MTEWPRLSTEDIEEAVERLLAKLAPYVLERPIRTPLPEIVQGAQASGRLRLELRGELGVTSAGKKILGLFEQEPPTIRLDASLADDDTKFRFTLAHELGHYLLHGDIALGPDVSLNRIIRDTEEEFSCSQVCITTARGWFEWQANAFAAALLVPRATLGRALRRVQASLEIFNNCGSIVLENEGYSFRDLNSQVRELCLIYLVSPTAMRIRLENRGLLIDRRSKALSSWSSPFGSL